MNCRLCGAPAEHRHHEIYRSNGGSDHPSNLTDLCVRCHVLLHSSRNDFRVWGRLGGLKTAATRKSFRNLRQFRGTEGEKRFENLYGDCPQNGAIISLDDKLQEVRAC